MSNKWQNAIADSGDSIRRFKIQAPNSGDVTKVRIRIVSDAFEDAWVHFYPGFRDDGTEGTRFAVCLKKGKCPICAKFEETGDDTYKAKRQFYINIIDRKAENPKVSLWQCGFGMFKDIAGLVDDDAGVSDPSEFDLVITRVGKKKNDTRYTVKPFMKEGTIVKKKLPSDLLKLLDLKTEDGGPYDLSELVKKKSADELVETLTGKFSKKSKASDDEDEDEPKKKKKNDDDEDDEPKNKKKKSSDDDDEDDEPKKKKKYMDDEDEEDDEPKKKKKKSDDDDEDEDEDDEPKKKKKKSDDDEDEDEDEEPKKKKRKDDDDEDEEEEDEPKKKKKKSSDDEDDD